MSALLRIADSRWTSRHVRDVPTTEVVSSLQNSLILLVVQNEMKSPAVPKLPPPELLDGAGDIREAHLAVICKRT
jgi:hypothetical protein